ncbi:putative transporter [Podospora fimiseda]|uniref:Transporter n=1 Tax=Podospora fimiseda TaxID=252190 RepID=A0AAN7BGV6_9PEZI|nr:putative transporter [Podospora fimiseda]
MVDKLDTKMAAGKWDNDSDSAGATVTRTEHRDLESSNSNKGLRTQSDTPLTEAEKRAEKKYLLKIDCIILPLIAAIYFLASLDRSDVSNAVVAGMGVDLKLNAGQISNCVAFFYIGFLAFQLPGSILVRVLTPPIQLGVALMIWGGATAIMTEANNWQTIAGLRVVVGAFEAFINGAPLYLTFWYKPDELATRGAIFMSMMNLAGSMNGLIAYAIQSGPLNGRYGRPAWRWIFLVEGVVSVGFGLVILFLLPTTPERVKWGFSKDEKKIAMRRTEEAYNVPNAKPNGAQFVAALKDPKTWFYSVLNACASISQGVWSNFLPILLRKIGYSANDTQLMSIPVYAVAGVCAIAVGIMSDRRGNRGYFAMGAFALTAAGWLILLVSKNRQLSYAGTYLVGAGSSPTIILVLAWINNNTGGYTKKASVLGIATMAGHGSAFAAVISLRDAPNFYIGKSLSFGSAIIAIGVSYAFMIYIGRKNARKLAEKDSPESIKNRALDVEQIHDDHPDFMYCK